MHRIIKLLLLILFFSVQIKAQHTNLAKANTLYSEEKYSAAQALFQQVILNERTKEQAYYYNAKCSKELFASDAIFLYKQFITAFPYSSYIQQVNEDLALLYYRDLDYPKAINYFLKFNSLEQHPDLVFKLAYANFSIDSLVDAQYYFSKLINTESKYAATAQYYSAYIAYQNGLYKTALNGFKHLIADEQFGPIIPYYITQILYQQNKYDELIEYGPLYIDSVTEKRKGEFAKLIGDSYFKKNQYQRSLEYYQVFKKHAKSTRESNYQVGYCYYKTKKYKNTK